MTKVTYKITHPNGKVYVGQDVTNSIGYFGSPLSRVVALDYAPVDRKKFTITREILWESENATRKEVLRDGMPLHR